MSDALPVDTPERVREGIWSFFREPIVATPVQITSGGHRITAMRRQGLERTVAVMAVDEDFDPAGDPRVYPGQ